MFKPSYHHVRFLDRRVLPFVLLIVVGLALLGLTIGPRFVRAVNPNPVAAAWERARSAGAYRFDGDVVQVTLPNATVANVGRSSRTETMHLEGQTDLRQATLQMRLWSDGGSVLQSDSAVAVKVENGKTFVRQGAGEWKEADNFSTDGLAPQGDFMAFLAAVRDITPHEPETRYLPPALLRGSPLRGGGGGGVSFTRYSFQIDGPQFASYIRDQLEQTMRAKGELPPETQLNVPAYYRDMTGEGELWVRSDGLPLREILTLDFPEQRDDSVHAQITVNFVEFGQPAPIGVLGQTLKVSETFRVFQGSLLPLLLMATFVGFLLRVRRSERLQNALALAVVASLVFTPLLSAIRVNSFLGVQAARAATQDEQQKEVDAARALHTIDAASQFNPHESPFAAAERRVGRSAVGERPTDGAWHRGATRRASRAADGAGGTQWAAGCHRPRYRQRQRRPDRFPGSGYRHRPQQS